MTFDVKKLTRTSLLLALAIVFQAAGRTYPVLSQFVTGPVVNAIFIICLITNGLSWSMLMSMMTPILAWLLGQLPQPLGPIVPVIALGNITYILVFHLVKNKLGKNIVYNGLGIAAASFTKFGCIFLGTKLLLSVLNLGPVVQKAAPKVTGPTQLYTALIGGLFALVLIEVLASRKQLNIEHSGRK